MYQVEDGMAKGINMVEGMFLKDVTIAEWTIVIGIRRSKNQRLNFPDSVEEIRMTGWTRQNITSIFMKCHETKDLI